MRNRLTTLVLAAGLAWAGQATAQTGYPDKPVTLVVPFPAGGSSDTVARKWGEVLARHLGQPIVIENVAGAGGSLGAQKVARAKADGYTLLMGSLNDVILTPLALKSAPYKSSDFQIAMVTGITAGVLVTGNQSGNPTPLSSAADVIAAARKKPLAFGTPGKGTFHHIVLESMAEKARIDLLHVPYKGGAQFLSDMIGGQINLAVTTVGAAVPFIASKQVRALAVTTATRSEVLKDVPTLAESSPLFKDVDLSIWAGIFAPKGTPRHVMDKLNAALRETHQAEQIQAFLRQTGSHVPSSGLDPFGAQRFLEAEERRYRAIAARLDLQE